MIDKTQLASKAAEVAERLGNVILAPETPVQMLPGLTAAFIEACRRTLILSGAKPLAEPPAEPETVTTDLNVQ